MGDSSSNYFNRKNKRVGHLFQGRYRGILVEGETYALELSRYIHLNPVRAHLAKAPLDYFWSSYSVYIKKENKWGWVHRNFILEQIIRNEKESQGKYRDYVEGRPDQTSKNPLEMITASILLGSDTFVGWVKKNFIEKATSNRDVPALTKLSLWPNLSTIQGEVEKKFKKASSIARRVAIFLAHRQSGLPLEKIGRHFGGISPSAVTQNTRRLEPKIKEDSRLAEKIEAIKQRICQ